MWADSEVRPHSKRNRTHICMCVCAEELPVCVSPYLVICYKLLIVVYLC